MGRNKAVLSIKEGGKS